MDEIELLADADVRARGLCRRRPRPAGLSRPEGPLGPGAFRRSAARLGLPAGQTLALLDEAGSPATVASNGPRYFGFVIGASQPVAAAAERLAIAWDQCASSFDNSPAAATIEKTAARWVLEALDLPAGSAVGFGTSASACGLACLSAARRACWRGRAGISTRRAWAARRRSAWSSPPPPTSPLSRRCE